MAEILVFSFAALLLTSLVLLGLNALIRRGLAAPRIRETANPDKFGLPWQEVRFGTVNGRMLGAWLVPATPAAPALVLLHGWGGNAEMMLPLAAPLHRAGYSLLLVDARNHGMSDGDSFSSLPRFAEDLDHAIDWLKGRPGTDPGRIGVLGHSVGAAAALLAASRRNDLAAVVSLAAFAHPEAMMRRWLAGKNIPWRPLGWYILKYVERAIGHRFNAIAPCNTICRVGCPTLIVHGTEDATVPVDEAQRIHAGRAHDGVQLLLLPGGHDEYDDIDRGLEEVIGFLDRAMKASRQPPSLDIPGN
jgi:pimeloyl-ACP methyl ester carboxylesterase